MHFTDRTIAAIAPPAAGQKLYADDAIPGFGVRVSQGGSKTFVLTVGSERRRITIGRYPIVSLAQARNRAKTILARRQLGLDKPLSPRFEDVREEFLANREGKVRSSSYRKDVHRLKVFDSLAKKRIADITPDDVQGLLDSTRAPSTRHEALIRFALLMRFAIKRRYVAHWPLDILEAPYERIARERVLTPRELRTVLSTAEVWRLGGHHFGAIVELLIYTGQRRHQIGGLDRSMVDFENETIIWPAELMKVGRKHMIPMGAAVRALLGPRRVNALYFPNKYGDPFTFASCYDRAFRADCGFDDWVLHDLRRTMATYWQEMGIEIATTEKMLSHSAITGGLVGVYQRSSFLSQMRNAVQKWEGYLQALLSKTEDAGG